MAFGVFGEGICFLYGFFRGVDLPLKGYNFFSDFFKLVDILNFDWLINLKSISLSSRLIVISLI